MANYYPITGIPVPVGQDPPPRREISSWAVSSEPVDQMQVSLFIRAVRKLQEKNPIQDKLSFYRIAGIHGYPIVSWDGVGGGYYCPHNTFTFPTWHRPYMLLYEQCLYNIMKNEIIPTIPDGNPAKGAWKQAEETWRLPYWDWAIPQVDYGAGKEKLGVPKLVDDSQVWILKLGEKEKELVPNPLYKFTNKINGEEINVGDQKKMGEFAIVYDQDKKSIFSDWIGTSRYADPGDRTKWLYGVQNNDKVTSSFTEHAWRPGGGDQTIAHNVFRILSEDYFKSYGPFSTTLYRQGPIPATDFFSLEQIHNHIHPWTGGYTGPQGHMANVPVSAFDPIFWLHHCIDELKRVIRSKYGNSVTVVRETKTTQGRLVDGIDDNCFKDYIINIEYDRYALGGEPYIVDFSVKGKDQPGRVGQVRHLGSFYTFSAPVLPDCEDCAAQKQSGMKSKAQVPITLPICNLAVDPEYPDPSGQEIPLEQLKGPRVTVHTGTAQYPTDASIKVFPDEYCLLLWSDENNNLRMGDALRDELR